MSAPRQLCSFRLEQQLFGIPVEQVQEVLRTPRRTAVPLAPPRVAGLINLRGQVVTAFDLRIRLGLSDRTGEGGGINVIVRTAEGPVSLLVDEIGDVIELDERAFEAPPETLQGDARDLIVGAYKLKDRLVLMLDLDRVLSTLNSNLTSRRTESDPQRKGRDHD